MRVFTVEQNRDRESYRSFLLPLIGGSLLLLFLAAPWSLEHKAHVALHGLCAQIPSHTFGFGGRSLPFDARMTGIYSGWLAAACWLVARNRYRAAVLPTWPLCAILAVPVALLGIDGFNSFLRDLGQWHPYTPQNLFRLLTGIGTGMTLAVILAYLCAISLWRRPDARQRVVGGVAEIGQLWLIQAPIVAVALGGASFLFAPTALLLVASALALLSTLGLISLVLLRQVDLSFHHPRELMGYASAAIVLGSVAMAGLSCGRFLLERWIGPSPLV